MADIDDGLGGVLQLLGGVEGTCELSDDELAMAARAAGDSLCDIVCGLETVLGEFCAITMEQRRRDPRMVQINRHLVRLGRVIARRLNTAARTGTGHSLTVLAVAPIPGDEWVADVLALPSGDALDYALMAELDAAEREDIAWYGAQRAERAAQEAKPIELPQDMALALIAAGWAPPPTAPTTTAANEGTA